MNLIMKGMAAASLTLCMGAAAICPQASWQTRNAETASVAVEARGSYVDEDQDGICDHYAQRVSDEDTAAETPQGEGGGLGACRGRGLRDGTGPKRDGSGCRRR